LAFILKLLALPAYPLGLSLTLIAVGLLLPRRRHGMGRLMIKAAAILLYVLSTPIAAHLLIRPLESPYLKQAALPRDCSAIVVLGGAGMPMLSRNAFPEINKAGDRLLYAAKLYKMSIAPRIITSGGVNVGSFTQNITEGEQNALILREIGVDSSAIITENRALTTAEHGPYIAAILNSLHLPKKIVLVTSAAHMTRARAVFRKYGFTTFPAAADFESTSKIVETFWDFFPSSWALEISTAAFHEYYGLVGYKVLRKI
jgi:uncharacterized SAM-binding protein YcdF (DUF218 family)